MHTIVTTEDNDEPTKEIEATTSRTLAALSRIDRLAELAIERLGCAPDDDALAAVVSDLVQVRAFCAEVTR